MFDWSANFISFMYKATPILAICLLLLAPGIHAKDPDFFDDEDPATGPVGIVGVSADSGGGLFRFDLHLDAAQYGDDTVRYTWQFRTAGGESTWTCDVRNAHNGPSLDCRLLAASRWAYDETRIHPDRFDAETSPATAPLGTPVQATHHLDRSASTVGFTMAYRELGLRAGDSITLVGGDARFASPNAQWSGAPADVMVLNQAITLR